MDEIILKQKAAKWHEALEYLKSHQADLSTEEWSAIDDLQDKWRMERFSPDMVDDASAMIDVLKEGDKLHSNNRDIIKWSKEFRAVARDIYTRDSETFQQFYVEFGGKPRRSASHRAAEAEPHGVTLGGQMPRTNATPQPIAPTHHHSVTPPPPPAVTSINAENDAPLTYDDQALYEAGKRKYKWVRRLTIFNFVVFLISPGLGCRWWCWIPTILNGVLLLGTFTDDGGMDPKQPVKDEKESADGLFIAAIILTVLLLVYNAW